MSGGSKPVTLFATGTTFESGIYQQGIKANKANPENLRQWNMLLEETVEESIETIIIACTDLNAVLCQSSVSVPIIDSAKCLAQTIVQRYLK